MDDDVDTARGLCHIVSTHGIAGIPIDVWRQTRPCGIAHQPTDRPAAAFERLGDGATRTTGGSDDQGCTWLAHGVLPLKVEAMMALRCLNENQPWVNFCYT